MKKISVILSLIVVICFLFAISVHADTPDPYIDISNVVFDNEGKIVTDENGNDTIFSFGYYEDYGFFIRSDGSMAIYGYEYINFVEGVENFDEYICSVYLSDELIDIGDYTAADFHYISKMRIGNKLQYIGQNAFLNFCGQFIVEGEKTDELLLIESGNEGLLKDELFSVYRYVIYYSQKTQSYRMVKDGELYSGFYTYEGSTAYFENGDLYTESFLNLNGKNYYFDEEHMLIKNGFVSSPEGLVYIEQGELYTGLKELEDGTYFFDNGYIFKGEYIKHDGKIYFFDEEHRQIKEGLMSSPEGLVYIEQGEPYTGLRELEDGTYFFDNGYIFQGEYVNRDGKTYYFDDEHRQIKDGFVSSPEGTQYLVQAEPIKGFEWIDGNTYYFCDDGYMYEEKYLTLDGKKYYFDDEYHLIINGLASSPEGTVYLVNTDPAKGFVQYGSKIYYFCDDGYMFEGEYKTIDGIKYYFSSAHSLENGVVDEDCGKIVVKNGVSLGVGYVECLGKTYYVSKITGFLNEKSELYIGGILHYFNKDYSLKNGLIYEGGISRMYENGVMVRGAFRDLDGDGKNDSYFLYSNGERVLYDKTIGGRDYAYESGKLILKQGLRYENGKYYYYDAGVKVGGYVSIGDKKYYFLKSTYEMITSSSYVIGGYKREFNPDHSIKPISGWQTLAGIRYYFENGEKVTGFKTIDSYTYYFMKSTEQYGAMASGWLTISDRVYYFFREGSEKYGRMAIGTQTIGGNKYIFNSNGTINNGFVSDAMGNVRYYYMSQELHGWYKIGNSIYYFSLVEGYMAKSNKIISGEFYLFGSNGVLLYPDYPDANELTRPDVSFGETFDGSSGGWGSVVFR